MSDLISREKLLNEINLLKKSPWYNKDFAAVKLVRKDAVAIVEKCVEEAPGVAEWISVKDRLPKRRGNYIVCGKWDSGKHSIGEVEFCKDKGEEEGYFETAWNFDVTHWMPLPKPPKE